ncbi:TadE/TadG family type IV pilus assembly protein [Streptomyces halstedii]|uniref:TadE/TadG family type IV pilus assembly protein n=1 Tax=Streptomyces halstedii TaxID=1944 RepID=UPI0036B3DCC2
MKLRTARRRGLNGPQRDDRGFASAEFAVLAVVILALVFSAIQVGLYFHARKVAQSAARQGVESGRQFASSPSDGVAQAQNYLARFGGSVRGASVTSTGSSTEEVRITVRGNVATLVPGLELTVTQHAEAPIERWTTP